MTEEKPPTTSPVLVPMVGFGELRLGMGFGEVSEILGIAGRAYTDPDGDLLVDYETLGLDILSFSKEDDYRLISMEVGPKSAARLWGARIFDLGLEAIQARASSLGVELNEVAPLTAGLPERELDAPFLSLVLYTDLQGRLTSVSFGVHVDDDGKVHWP